MTTAISMDKRLEKYENFQKCKQTIGKNLFSTNDKKPQINKPQVLRYNRWLDEDNKKPVDEISNSFAKEEYNNLLRNRRQNL